MKPTDLTIEILKGIREETRKTSEGLQQTNEEVRKLGAEVGRRMNGSTACEPSCTGRWAGSAIA